MDCGGWLQDATGGITDENSVRFREKGVPRFTSRRFERQHPHEFGRNNEKKNWSCILVAWHIRWLLRLGKLFRLLLPSAKGCRFVRGVSLLVARNPMRGAFWGTFVVRW